MTEQRTFIPGNEWLYLKIYTGVKTADIILEETMQPLVEYFQENNYITKWFFIRYNDPKPHLRLRFKLSSNQHYNVVLGKIKTVFQEYVESGEISNIQIDTYKREIERYGKNTIEDAEILFQKNSEFVLHCLNYDDEEKIIVSLFYINEILNTLNLTAQEKLNWVRDFNQSFKKEFNADKQLNSQLDKKYRNFKTEFSKFINSEEFLEERNAIHSNIDESSLTIQNIIIQYKSRSLEISLQSFFQSIFHMNINRMFVSEQRLFEMIIYDHLMRYCKSMLQTY